MKKTILLLAAVTGASSASALTLTLENPIVTAYAPTSGTATFEIRGTLALSPSETFSGGGTANAFDGSGNSVALRINQAEVNSVMTSVGSFTGVLGFVDVESADPVGLYNVDSIGILPPTIGFEAVTTFNTTVTSYASYAVDVQPVPEPASLAALGLGALGLMRRRRRASSS